MARPFDELSAVGRARRLRALVHRAMPAWGLDVLRVQALTNDYNGVFRVDTPSGSFAARVSLPFRTDAQLRAECAWLDALRDVVEAPRVVRTRTRAPWTAVGSVGVPGPRRVTLFTWIPGRTMRADDDPASFAALGELTAALHDHAERWRRPQGLLTWDRLFPFPDEPPIVLDLPLPASERSIWCDAEQAGTEGFRMIAGLPTPPRITHMDVSPANAKVHRARVTLLDFDDCMLAQPVQDLAVSTFRCRSRAVRVANMRAFRDGYERCAAWPDQSLVERFVAASALELANAVYQDFDPDYRANAHRLSAKWARIARDAMRRI